MKKFTRKELVAYLIENNTTQPKAKYSNNILLRMLDKASEDFTATIEDSTRKGFPITRGSLCECLVKHLITGEKDTVKSQAGQCDLNTLKVANTYGLPRENDIEVKYSTTFANASELKHDTKYVLIISQLGAHLIESKNIIKTDSGKININNQRAKDLIELKSLEKVLGF